MFPNCTITYSVTQAKNQVRSSVTFFISIIQTMVKRYNLEIWIVYRFSVNTFPKSVIFSIASLNHHLSVPNQSSSSAFIPLQSVLHTTGVMFLPRTDHLSSFFKFIHLSNLYNQHRTRAHGPKIKRHRLFRLSQLGAPNHLSSLNLWRTSPIAWDKVQNLYPAYKACIIWPLWPCSLHLVPISCWIPPNPSHLWTFVFAVPNQNCSVCPQT